MTPQGKRIAVVGDATWGAGDPHRVKMGSVHNGHLEGSNEPGGAVLSIADVDTQGDCTATLRLMGRYLVVVDNGACGGANVSFNGIYLRNLGNAK